MTSMRRGENAVRPVIPQRLNSTRWRWSLMRGTTGRVITWAAPKVLLACLTCVAFSGCLSYRLDRVIDLQVKGQVHDSQTCKPISGVSVSLESDRLIGKGRAMPLGVSTDDGMVYCEHEEKWGYKKNALAVWIGLPGPRAYLTITLSKDRYSPVEMNFRLDKLPGVAGSVPVDLGEVYLVPIPMGKETGGAGPIE